MEGFTWFVLVLIGIAVLIMLCFAIKSKKVFKTLFLNAFIGIVLLAIINLTAKFTGVNIPVNEYTVSGSAVFGVPALCGFLVLKFIFI